MGRVPGVEQILTRLKSFKSHIGPLVAGLFLGFALVLTPTTSAVNDMVVSISIDGSSRTVRTTAGTVGEVIDRAEIEVYENDLVEPAVDSEIVGPVYNINIYRARPVLVHDGDSEYIVRSAYSSPFVIADKAGLDVHREDLVELKLIDDFLRAGTVGQELFITRATPLTLELYGNKIEHRSHGETVADVLAEKSITLDEKDVVKPALTTPLTDNMKVQIIRVGSETLTEEEKIAFDTKTIWDDSLTIGVKIVDQDGVAGLKVVTYDIILHNDDEHSRKETKTVVKLEPVTEIVRLGTKTTGAGSNVELGQQLAASRGWTDEEWTCLFNLWQKESHWNNLAQNPNSTAFGIPQFLDSTWAGTGYTKTTDPTTQIKAGMAYISGRYGTPCGAANFSASNGWY